MLRGLYTAAGGMITQQRRHDIITNNIANLNTAGYKEQTAVSRSFPEMLIHLVNGGEGESSKAIGHLNTGVMVEEVLPNFTQGDLMETGRASDFALISNIRVFEQVGGEEVEIAFDASGRGESANGETIYQPQAFFTVLNEQGEYRYTRNGQFYVDAEGWLRTTDGMRLVGTDGEPISLNAPDPIPINQIRMTENGVLLDAESGDPIGDEQRQLLITQVNDPYQLVREGNGNFRLMDEAGDVAVALENPEDISIQQGFIERSNVDPTESSVNLMTALRMYEANQKVIQYYDRSIDKAVNDIGRIG